MSSNPHFRFLESWSGAAQELGFEPRVPDNTLGHPLNSLAVFFKDHRMRILDLPDRMLEAHYGAFVLAQSLPGRERAERLAFRETYGRVAGHVSIGGCPAVLWESPTEEDPSADGTAPLRVLVWAEGDRLILIASASLSGAEILRVGRSMY